MTDAGTVVSDPAGVETAPATVEIVDDPTSEDSPTTVEDVQAAIDEEYEQITKQLETMAENGQLGSLKECMDDVRTG